MMLADLASYIFDLSRYGQYAMLIFFFVFVAICVRTALTGNESIQESASLPLADDEAPKS